MQSLDEQLHIKKTIGNIQRVFVDFGIAIPLSELPADSRLKNPALGAGALLDIGIYSLTYASIILGTGRLGNEHPQPKVASTLDVVNGIDESNVVVLSYDEPKATAICTSTIKNKSSEDFARIEGSEGTITIFGIAASCPSGFRISRTGSDETQIEQVFKFDHPPGTVGFFYEADAVAIDVINGRKESGTMPLDETLRMLRLMDSIRADGGLVYPQDQR